MTDGSNRTVLMSPRREFELEHAGGLDALAGRILDATQSDLGAATAAMFLVQESDTQLQLQLSSAVPR
jgi:hypothetical protein